MSLLTREDSIFFPPASQDTVFSICKVNTKNAWSTQGKANHTVRMTRTGWLKEQKC